MYQWKTARSEENRYKNKMIVFKNSWICTILIEFNRHIQKEKETLFKWYIQTPKILYIIRSTCSTILWFSVSSVWFGGTGTFWAQKIVQEKLAKVTKVLDHITSSRIISGPRCLDIPIIYVRLQEEPTHFGLTVLTNFGVEVSGQFRSKHFCKKHSKNPQWCLNYIKSSYIFFLY